MTCLAAFLTLPTCLSALRRILLFEAPARLQPMMASPRHSDKKYVALCSARIVVVQMRLRQILPPPRAEDLFITALRYFDSYFLSS